MISRQVYTVIKMNIILRAKTYAYKQHLGMVCDEGSPYIYHPFQVAQIMSLVTTNPNLIATAYLHDVIEDTTTTYNDILRNFNKQIADLVFELTHVKINTKVGLGPKWHFPNLQSRDASLIKFADRLSNLSRMGNWDEKRKAKYLAKSMFWDR